MTQQARLLGGRYQVGELLGYGGMAEVHRGRDLRLGRDVAIKMLRVDLARDATFQTRFRREAQNAASLNHPAIVAVYDTGEETGADGAVLPFIVMEFVNGRTLKEVLTAEGRLMPRRALEIAADICAALDFSNRHGIIHRDVKPGNVMLTGTGQVKVMDFGIARALMSNAATMTQTSAVIGTAQYLSPEQARGEAVDARSDVYSAGCVLYELLCGHPPFTGDNPVSVAYQHVREDPRPPSDLNPDVGPEVDAVVLKALAKNPANRYQSAGEMRADLLRAASGRPVQATPVLPADERTQFIAPVPVRRGAHAPMARVAERRRRAATWALVSLALLGVFALAAVGTGLYLANQKQRVAVPNVIGLTVQEASNRLTEKGFEVNQQPQAGCQDKGKVLEQSPAADELVEKGSPVQLTVCAGPNMVAVPNVVGSTRTAAEEQLRNAKLTFEVREESSDKPPNTVTRTDPPAGRQVAEGAKVVVYVSRGDKKPVPEVLNRSEAEARAILDSAGFKVTIVYRDARPDEEPDRVVDQSPRAGTPHAAGGTVRLVVTRAPSPSPSSSSPTPPPPGP